jgi:hypothetical protein
MTRIVILLSFLLINSLVFSQHEPNNSNRGVIKVAKKGQLARIVFNNVDYKLIGIDNYGNVIDTAVIEFVMTVRIRGILYKEKQIGCYLNREMQYLLDRRDSNTSIYFEDIKAKDRSGNFVSMPKFKYSFPYHHNDEY